MASKGPEAFRTISEVAGDLDLPQHVLRFWETRFTQIRPMKRGGGRRYYRPDDVDLLRGIRHLLYSEGYTIRGVQRLLKEQGPRFVTAAGRGDMSGLQDAPLDDDDEVGAFETEDIDEAPAARLLAPAFDPSDVPEFRPSAPNGRGKLSGRLPADDVRRLQGTLADLLELKRLLDQARG